MAEQKKRGRPPKYATKEQQETLRDYANFLRSDAGARAVANRITTGMNDLHNLAMVLAENGMYTPVLSEQFLQEIGFQSASSSTEELAMWLQHPERYDINLRRLSNYLENAVAQYGRAVSVLSDIKTYNYDLRCGSPNLAECVNTDSFKLSKDRAMRTLQKLNIPYQIRRLDKRVCEDGVVFVWFKRHSDGIDLMEIPADFCYITAPWTYGYLFAIDLTYFDRFAYVEQNVPELWAAYDKFCEMRIRLARGETGIDPVAYQYYPVSPYEGWCCVFDSSRPLKIPPMIGGALGALDSLGYRDLIKQKTMIDLWRVISYKIPINQTTGKMQITYKEASSIIDAVQAVLPDNFIAVATPFEAENPINADQKKCNFQLAGYFK